MIALIGAVLVASLLGSAHCAGMCGAFLLLAVTEEGASSVRRRAELNAAYNLGRLMTYVVLGLAAGALGAAVDLGAEMVGVQRAAGILAGAVMVVFGGLALARHSGVRIARAGLPRWLESAGVAGHRAIAGWPPLARAAGIGLLTTLLPCGWLYAFVVSAAGTASPALGAVTMAVFWMGTLPMMATLGAGLQVLTGPLRARLPLLTSALLVVVGLMAVSGRLVAPRIGPGLAMERDAVSMTEAAARVRSLDHRELPCCTDAR